MEINIIAIILTAIVLFLISIIFLIHFIPIWRLNILKREIKAIEIKWDTISNVKKLYQRLSTLIPIVSLKGDKDENEILRAKTLIGISNEIEGLTVRKEKIRDWAIDFQNEILELENRSQFEPQFWWPQKSVEKLQKLKDTARHLLQEIREQTKE